MTLFAIGINHKTAPVDLREQVAFTPDTVVEALSDLKHQNNVSEAIVLSTCNRTEIYATVADDSDGKAPVRNDSRRDGTDSFLINWLSRFHGVGLEQISDHLYQLKDQKAVEHMMSVACGLDSLVLGEPQILGQVKQAYQQAKLEGVAKNHFERLFQHIFSVAKRVRTETDIGESAVSVAYASVQLAKRIFSKLEKRSVLLIGAGETIELVAKHLSEANVKHFAVSNRTIERGQKLAAALNGKAFTLAQLPSHIHEYDIVISSTASQLPLVGKGMIGDALKKRKNQPMLLIDLAVPRDIESQVDDIDDAYLYTVDDLQLIVEANMASREDAAQVAKRMIKEQVNAYQQWQSSEKQRSLVKQYRNDANKQKDLLLDKAIVQLKEGKDPQEVLLELGHRLTNALLHVPTKILNDTALHENNSVSNALLKHFDISPSDVQLTAQDNAERKGE